MHIEESNMQNSGKYSPIAQLVDLGRKKSYITLDDILQFFPYPEQQMEQIDLVFASLISAGIPFIENNQAGDNIKEE
jgi:RNA polymerase primary sigma factor